MQFCKPISLLIFTSILILVAGKTSLEKEIDVFIENGSTGRNLKTATRVLDLGKLARGEDDPKLWPEPKLSLFCSLCTTFADRVLNSPDKENVFNSSISVCIQLGIGNDVFCQGIVQENEDTLTYIYQNSDDLTGKDICGTVFVRMGCKSNNPEREWEVQLPDVPKPPVSEPQYPQGNVPTLKVLHFADTHYDPNYLPGSNAKCPEIYFCCNADSGPVEQPEDAAGFWGDYRNCDIPKWTLEALYEHINTTHPDIDFIIWTGDLIPHIVWDTSRDANIQVINDMADLLLKYFPGVPVFPAVGNHEGDPVNLFPQPYIDDPEFDISWLYDELASVWSNWLPSDTATSIAYSAYYSTIVRPGLRIISLNTNYCYSMNWWLVYDSSDISNELEYLAQELQRAEDAGDSVYIIGHHAPGDVDCEYTWSHQFNRIISRYEDTVTGMFYGHTHNDHYEIFFDQEDANRPFDVAYIAQSQTPYSDLNPGYKVYTIEGDFNGSRFRVLDHENWILDLDKTNRFNRTNLYKLYSAKEDYGLSDLSPESWFDLVVRMMPDNSTLFDDFYRNYVKAGTPSLEAGCDDKCKTKILCELVTSDRSDDTQCKTMGLN